MLALCEKVHYACAFQGRNTWHLLAEVLQFSLRAELDGL